MTGATNYQRFLAVLIFFTLAAGDFWRYLLSWWGWGVIVAFVLTAAIVEIVRARIDVRRLPIPLLLFLGLGLISIIWSQYRASTALGVVITLIATVLAVFLALCFDWDEVLSALGTSIRWILGLSLIFELFVATVIGHKILPFWVDYSDLDKIPNAFYWSRALLFEGGRIQGIVGNANLLAMTALLGLILFTVRLTARRGSPIWNTVWVVAAVGTLALTRSTTVMVAGVVVALVAGFLLLVRRTRGRTRRVVTWSGLGLGVLAVVGAVLARDSLLALLGKSSDLTHRLEIWDRVLNLAVQRPVAGWGWVAWWNPWVEPFKDLAVFGGVRYLQAHNAWIDVFLQLGVLGVIVLLVLVLSTLIRSWTMAADVDPTRAERRRIAWPISAVPLLLMVALIVQSFAESRLLVEIGWSLLVVIAIKTAWRDAQGIDRSTG